MGSLRFRNVGRQEDRETLGPRVQEIPGFLTNPLSGKLVLFRRSVQWKRTIRNRKGRKGYGEGMASNPAHRLPFLSDVKKTTFPVPQGSSAFHSSICAIYMHCCMPVKNESARSQRIALRDYAGSSCCKSRDVHGWPCGGRATCHRKAGEGSFRPSRRPIKAMQRFLRDSILLSRLYYSLLASPAHDLPAF